MVARKRGESEPVRAKFMSNARQRSSQTVRATGRVIEQLERRVLLSSAIAAFVPQLTFSTGAGPNDAIVADINRDGKPDLLIANQDDNTVSILLGNGDGTFAPQTTFSTRHHRRSGVAGHR